MKEKILGYIEVNKKTITILVFCMIIGFLISIILYQFLSDSTKNEISSSIVSVLNMSKESNFEGINVINNGIASNAILIFCIYATCITIICPLLVSLFNFFKGFTFGIYILTLFQVFGFKNGILTTILVAIIPNIIYLPTYIYLSTNSINASYDIINGKNKYNLLYLLVKEFYHLIIVFSFILLSLLLEQILSGVMINIYRNMV